MTEARRSSRTDTIVFGGHAVQAGDTPAADGTPHFGQDPETVIRLPAYRWKDAEEERSVAGSDCARGLEKREWGSASPRRRCPAEATAVTTPADRGRGQQVACPPATSTAVAPRGAPRRRPRGAPPLTSIGTLSGGRAATLPPPLCSSHHARHKAPKSRLRPVSESAMGCPLPVSQPPTPPPPTPLSWFIQGGPCQTSPCSGGGGDGPSRLPTPGGRRWGLRRPVKDDGDCAQRQRRRAGVDAPGVGG